MVQRKNLPYFLVVGLILALIIGALIEKRLKPTVLRPGSNTLPVKLGGSFYAEENVQLLPLSSEAIVILLEGDQKLIALSSETGKAIWERELENPVNLVARDKARPFNISQEFVVVLAGEKQFMALTINTGEVVWDTELATPIENFTDVLIMDSVIIVTGIDSSSKNRVSGYSIENGQLMWQIVLPSRVLQHMFPCAGIPTSETILTNMNTVCLLMLDNLVVVDPLTIAQTLTPAIRMNISVSLYSSNKPVYYDGFIFTNPSHYTHVFEVSTQAEFDLPDSCTEGVPAKPVSTFSNQILVATGCNDIYTLPIDELRDDPAWMLDLPDRLFSSFVTLDGQWGYVLTQTGELLAVDLLSGQRNGAFVVESVNLQGRDRGNGLVANPPYLYALINEYNLFIFE